MKIKQNALITWFAAALAIFSLAACDTRPIPGDLILSTYNSEMEATRQFSPMDTLYVKVAGMRAHSYYQIKALDADNETISTIEAQTDADGVIGPVALWYDVGVKGDASGNLVVDSYGDLTPVGFKVNVKSLYDGGDSTDFTQDMFLVYGKAATDNNPKPVFYACYTEDDVNYYPENAFRETGTLDAAGAVDPKTKVYVKADRVPTMADGAPVTQVDFYVLHFTGGIFQDGDALALSDQKAFEPVTAAVNAGAVGATLLWDLNVAPTLINPDEDTMAYTIVMDVNRNGVFDAGVDTDSDGVSDYFVDGVESNGLPSFIVQNTPANDMFVTIKDAAGNIVNAIPESGAVAAQDLTVSIDNVPTASVTIYLVDSFSGADGAAIPADVRLGAEDVGVVPTVPATIPDAQLRFLPYIEDRALLTTRGVVDTHYPPAGTLVANVALDLVVDLDNDGVFTEGTDYFIENAVTVLDVPSGDYATCSDSAGNTETPYFNESNDPGNTVVYLKAENAPESFDVYVLNTVQGGALAVNDALAARAMFSVADVTGDPAGTVTSEIWDLNGAHKVINPKYDNNTYYLVVDNDGDGIFDGTDDKLTIVILNTITNAYPRVSYVNIASGGSFGNTWAQHWTLYSQYCDYRDNFTANGLDTNPYGAGYGVKAVFNPYFTWFGYPAENPQDGLYYGRSVDVYIVNAATFDLADYGQAAGALTDAIDVTGRHSTLTVQPSCYNGAGMMNIWPAPMTAGRYYVIVDVNQNGIIDEGLDIIDAVTQDGDTIVDDPTVVGFTVD